MIIPRAFLIGVGIFPSAIGFLGNMGNFSLGMELAGRLVLCGTGVAYYFKLTAE